MHMYIYIPLWKREKDKLFNKSVELHNSTEERNSHLLCVGRL